MWVVGVSITVIECEVRETLLTMGLPELRESSHLYFQVNITPEPPENYLFNKPRRRVRAASPLLRRTLRKKIANLTPGRE